MILESLVSEPQNRVLLLAYENAFAEILFSDGRYSDTFARILYELTSIDQTTKWHLHVAFGDVAESLHHSYILLGLAIVY